MASMVILQIKVFPKYRDLCLVGGYAMVGKYVGASCRLDSSFLCGCSCLGPFACPFLLLGEQRQGSHCFATDYLFSEMSRSVPGCFIYC